MNADRQKQSGAYYTPKDAAVALVSWAVQKPSDRMLDPSAGDGRFLELHRRSVGVEQDASAAAAAMKRAPWALIHEGDFFTWAASTKERFECAAGNPPFIRYQRFSGTVREKALALCASFGVKFSGLASSWAPFLVAAASLLKPGGRMAFIVPAEIGHAPYAQPLLEYLAHNFSDVRLLAVKKKIFSELSEDVWLLYAAGFGAPTKHFLLSSCDSFAFDHKPPEHGESISVATLAQWRWRLRSFLLPRAARALYLEAQERKGVTKLGKVARVGIGYVTGANDFFHLRPSLASKLGIPRQLLQPAVRNGRVLDRDGITQQLVRSWYSNDEAFLLLNLLKHQRLPKSVTKYLDTAEARMAKASYKCQSREPWYVVPDVVIPHAFLSYMSGDGPALVANKARCACTNSVHTVQLTGAMSFKILQEVWGHPLTRLSCELEGHPLGGGMLKVEPREAQRVVLDPGMNWTRAELRAMTEGMVKLQRWRHAGG